MRPSHNVDNFTILSAQFCPLRLCIVLAEVHRKAAASFVSLSGPAGIEAGTKNVTIFNHTQHTPMTNLAFRDSFIPARGTGQV